MWLPPSGIPVPMVRKRGLMNCIQTLTYLHLNVTCELCSWQIKIVYLAESFKLENYKYINLSKCSSQIAENSL